MANYEWVLTTPVTRSFERQTTSEIEVHEPFVNSDGNPDLKIIKKQVATTSNVDQQATVVRIAALHNDTVHHRLFVRFNYGRLDGGQFVTPVLDDGIVFGGPTYADHEFHTNPTALEEQILLNKIAVTMKWDGAMRPVQNT